jgi:hypothetical protein
MKIVALTCPQCGGSQDVSDDQRTLDCRYCNVALRVERLPNGELERLLVEAREENSLLLIRNRMLEIQNAIHRIDDEWELSRKKFMIKTKQGEREPAANAVLLGYVFGCGIAFFGIMIALNGKSGAMVGLILPIMGVVVICMGHQEETTRRALERAREDYMSTRGESYRQLGNLKRSEMELMRETHANGKD